MKINANYISIWSNGYEIITKCIINLDTKEVEEIEIVDVPEVNDYICTEEYVEVSGKLYPVYEKEDYSGIGVWRN